jgi:SPP1 family predicted phage head-tail adaptor
MRYGTLDRRVVLQRRASTLTPSGQPFEVWEALATRWASVGPLTGAERFATPQLTAKEVVEIHIRHSAATADVHPGDRIVLPSGADPDSTPTAVYDILAVHEVGRREGHRIIAERQPVPDAVYFDADAQVVITATGTPATSARATAINASVLRLKTAGVWNRLDALYRYAAAGAPAALVNWKSPGTFDCAFVGAVTFAPDVGITGANNAAIFTTTGFNPTLGTPRFARDSACRFGRVLVYAGDVFSAVWADLADVPSNTLQIGYFGRTNAQNLDIVGGAEGAGFVCCNRPSAASQELYKDGILAGAAAHASIALQDTTFVLHRAGAGGAGNSTLASHGFGASLDAAQQAALTDDDLAYMQEIGLL